MRKMLTVAIGAAATLSTLAIAPTANAADVTVRPADVTHEDTRSAGHNVFLNEGVRIFTDDNSSNAKATGYYDVGVALDDMSGFSQDWAGTDPQPGLQIVVDDPATEAASDGILVYEPIYGGDLWLTNGSSQHLKDLAPSHEGGSGTANHGTLAQWQEVTNLTVLKGGWSLGSGVKGSGVLVSQTLGDTTYTFSKADAQLPVARPVATATIDSSKRGVAKVHVRAEQPAGTRPTERGAYYRVMRTVRGAAADGIIENAEIIRGLAKGRVRGNDGDRMRFEFNKPTKITVVSYGEILRDKFIR